MFSRLGENDSWIIIPRVLRFVRRTNTGTAFGLFAGANWLFVGITFVAVGAVIWYLLRYARPDEHMATAGTAVVAAGALGNLIDRIAFGAVRDFVDFYVWPTFNVADVLICVGALVLALSSFRTREGEANESA